MSTAQAVNWRPFRAGKRSTNVVGAPPTENQSGSQSKQGGKSQGKGLRLSRRGKALVGLGVVGLGLSVGVPTAWFHFGEPLSLDAFRGPMAAHLSHLAGQQVRVDGPVVLVPGGGSDFDLALKAGGLSVGSASVRNATLSLRHLFSGRRQADLHLDDVEVRVGADVSVDAGGPQSFELPRLPLVLGAWDLRAEATHVKVHYPNPVLKGQAIEARLKVRLTQQQGQPTRLVLGGEADGATEGSAAVPFLFDLQGHGSLSQWLSPSAQMAFVLSGNLGGAALEGKAESGPQESIFALRVGGAATESSSGSTPPEEHLIRGPGGWKAEAVHVEGALRRSGGSNDSVVVVKGQVTGAQGHLPTPSGARRAPVEKAELTFAIESGKASTASVRGLIGDQHPFVLEVLKTATPEQLAQLFARQKPDFKTRLALTLGDAESSGKPLSLRNIMAWADRTAAPWFSATADQVSLTASVPYADNILEAVGGSTTDVRIDGVQAAATHGPRRNASELKLLEGTFEAHADPAMVEATLAGTVEGQPLEVRVSRSATMAQLLRWFRGEEVHLETFLNVSYGHATGGKGNEPIRLEKLCAWVGVTPPVEQGTARLFQFDGHLTPGGSWERMLAGVKGHAGVTGVAWTMPDPLTDAPTKVKAGHVTSHVQSGESLKIEASNLHFGDLAIAAAKFTGPALDELLRQPEAPFKLNLHTEHLNVAFDVGAGARRKFTATVDGEGRGFEELMEGIGLRKGPTIDRFKGKVRWSPDKGLLSIEKWSLAFGSTSLRVDADYKPGQRSVWNARVEAGDVELRDLHGVTTWIKGHGAQTAPAPATKQHAFSAVLDWVARDQSQTTVHLDVGRLLLNGALLANDGRGRIHLSPETGGRVEVNLNTPSGVSENNGGTVDDAGKIAADLKFWRKPRHGADRAKFLVEVDTALHTVLDPTVRWLKTAYPKTERFLKGESFPGRLRFRADLSAELSDLAGTLLGEVRSAVWPENFYILPYDEWVGKGLLELVVDFVADDAPDALGLTEPQEKLSQLVCAGSTGDVRDGVLRVQRGIIDTSQVVVSAAGQVDLGKRTVDMRSQPVARHGAGKLELLRVALPMYLSGPFGELVFSVGGDTLGKWFESGIQAAMSMILTPLNTAVDTLFSPDDDPCQLAMDYKPPPPKPPPEETEGK